MSIEYSNDFDAMVSQIKAGASGPSDNTIAVLAQQIQILAYGNVNTDGWTTTTQMKIADLTAFGVSTGTANAILAITDELVKLSTLALGVRKVAFDSEISNYKTIESGYTSENLAWYYNIVAATLIKGSTVVNPLEVLEPYRPAKLVGSIGSDLAELPFPTVGTLNLYRSGIWEIQQGIPYYNSENNQVKIWRNLPAPTFDDRIPLTEALFTVQGTIGTPLNDAKFIAAINLMKSRADELNSWAYSRGLDYDALRWMYDGPEQTISIIAANNHVEIQQAILKKISNVARDTSITSYSAIEQQLQTAVIPGLELNFSAALTTLCMFAKINLETPGVITSAQARSYLADNYRLNNIPEFVFSGLGVSLTDLEVAPLDLTNFQLAPEVSISKNQILILAGIGVTLLTTFMVFNIKSLKQASTTSAVTDAFDAVKNIVVDVAVTGVVLTVLVETALIYSKTGSVGGTIAQILADGVILFVQVLEDLFADLWGALKGEWAKFIAVIGSAAGVIAGGEAVIGTDLIAGSAEIAAGEDVEGAEVAAGEVAEGAEEEAGDIVEGFEGIFDV